MLSLHSDPYYIFFYQGDSATVDLYDNYVLRFAHSVDVARGVPFWVLTDGYIPAPFEYSVKINTPLPYHSELHINRIRSDYEGKYIIIYDHVSSDQLQPRFTINVNGKAVCMSNRADQM